MKYQPRIHNEMSLELFIFFICQNQLHQNALPWYIHMPILWNKTHEEDGCSFHMFKLHSVESSAQVLTFHFIPSITTAIGINGRAASLSNEIKDQKKEKSFLYNPIMSGDSYIKCLPIMTPFQLISGIWCVLFSSNKTFISQGSHCLNGNYPKEWWDEAPGTLLRARAAYHELLIIKFILNELLSLRRTANLMME